MEMLLILLKLSSWWRLKVSSPHYRRFEVQFRFFGSKLLT
ncbi:hypothetical protein PS1_009937 [Malus domestica]